jgi:hypothetical protein
MTFTVRDLLMPRHFSADVGGGCCRAISNGAKIPPPQASLTAEDVILAAPAGLRSEDSSTTSMAGVSPDSTPSIQSP